MWKRVVKGLTLTFRLAGINNQNFLMRDEETGTFWQQISGAAVAGPLRGEQLELVPADELTFGLWRAEAPAGTVLREVAEFAPQYAKKDWEERMQKSPTVLSYAEQGMAPRTLVVGMRAFGAARAYSHALLLEQKLVQDRVGGTAVMIVTGPDGKSLRAFRTGLGRGEEDFYRTEDGLGLMMDSETGSRWNFQGCAEGGPRRGQCLERVSIIQDYWFDWKHYNPETSVFRNAERRK